MKQVSDARQVQDNVIVVPMHMSDEIYACYLNGIDLGSIAVLCNTTVFVVKAMIRARQRNILRTRYLGDKEPA